MMKGSEHLSREERLREQGQFSPEKAQRGPLQFILIPEGRVQREQNQAVRSGAQ